MCVADDCFGWFGQTILPKVLLSLLCWMAWPNHFSRVCQAVALSSCQSFFHCFLTCLPDDCFAGSLGQLILPKACFHLYLFVCQVIALPDGLARSCCHRFCLISIFYLPHDCFAGWLGMAWPDHFAKGLFDVLSFVARTIALLDGLARSF